MTDANALISLIREHGHEIRVEFGVARLGVFGSRVRGEAGAESDLDVLVESVPHSPVDFAIVWDMAANEVLTMHEVVPELLNDGLWR